MKLTVSFLAVAFVSALLGGSVMYMHTGNKIELLEQRIADLEAEAENHDFPFRRES